MRFDSRYIERSLRVAEQAEIQDSDEALFGDLHTELTPDKLEDGVSIVLGDQREVLERILETLGIQDLLQGEFRTMHLQNVVVASGSTVSYLGKCIEEAGNISIVDLLDALQADHWTTYDQAGMYPHMQPDSDFIQSKIVATNSLKGPDDMVYADVSTIGIVVGVTNRYLPDFDSKKKSLGYFFRDTEEIHGDFFRNVVGPMIAEMSLDGKSLKMPSRRYFIKIGVLRPNTSIPMATVDDVMTAHSYKIESGRLRPA